MGIEVNGGRAMSLEEYLDAVEEMEEEAERQAWPDGVGEFERAMAHELARRRV